MPSLEGLLKNIFLILCAFFVILILYLTHLMSDFLVPIFFAFFMSLMLQPILLRLSKTKIPTWISTIVVVILSVFIISALVFILFSTLQNFLDDFPYLSDQIQKRLLSMISGVSQLPYIKDFGSEEKLKTFIFEFFAKINFGAYMISTMSKTISILKDLILFIFSLIFIMPGINKISIKFSRAFPENSGKINKIIHNITSQIQKYIVVKSIVSLVTGALTYIICLIFGVKYALLWGFLAFLFNYIPYVGSILAVLLPFTMSIIQSQTLIKPIILLSILTTIQQIIGNFLEPKFQGQGANLSTIVVFTSLLIWGFIWGIAGVFLAVPLMSAINVICENIDTLKPFHYLISSKKRKKRKKNKDIITAE